MNISITTYILLFSSLSHILSSASATNNDRWSSPLCGQLALYGGAGNFSSPNYPENYNLDNLDCRYLIDVSVVTYSRILLAFTDFSTDSSDYVEIYEGSSIESSPRIGVFSGDTIPNRILSNSSFMIVRFSTDYTDSNYRGFSASWLAV